MPGVITENIVRIFFSGTILAGAALAVSASYAIPAGCYAEIRHVYLHMSAAGAANLAAITCDVTNPITGYKEIHSVVNTGAAGTVSINFSQGMNVPLRSIPGGTDTVRITTINGTAVNIPMRGTIEILEYLT